VPSSARRLHASILITGSDRSRRTAFCQRLPWKP
jgi:hypothetical protein